MLASLLVWWRRFVSVWATVTWRPSYQSFRLARVVFTRSALQHTLTHLHQHKPQVSSVQSSCNSPGTKAAFVWVCDLDILVLQFQVSNVPDSYKFALVVTQLLIFRATVTLALP